MTFSVLSPAEAKSLIDGGALLVDIRGADERARRSIPGSVHAPLGSAPVAANRPGQPVIFHCRSGNRTTANASALAAMAGGDAYCLAGGIDAWKAAGLPVKEDLSQPIEIMRQVQIGAGSLVLTGFLLGWLVNPAWFGISAFVGAGLMFAGITGWCGMAKLLAFAPWNRRANG